MLAAIMTSTTTSGINPPPYDTDSSITIFLNDTKVPQGNPFYKLVEEARKTFLDSSNILEYMAESTFVDEPTQEAQQAREKDIRDFLQYHCPVIIGRKSAEITTSSTANSSASAAQSSASPGKEMNGECVYLDQDMIDSWAAKKCPVGRRLLLSFLIKLILLREFTISAWSIYGGKNLTAITVSEIRDSTPFAPPPDVWVSECGHVFGSYRRGKSRELQSVVFLNDEGGWIDIPPVDTPVLRKLAAGDWSVFQVDVITSIGPYRKASKKDYLERIWTAPCECTGLGSGNIAI